MPINAIEASIQVSVIIPCYNRANVVMHAIESVFQGNNTGAEVVVVDDGSTDNLKQVIERMGNPHVRYIRQDNKGANAARNNGIDHARGEFVAFLDSDDRFLPHHLASSIAALRSSGGPDVSYARIIVDRGRGKSFIKPPRTIRAAEAMGDYLLADRGFVQTSTVVMKRALAAQVRYDEKLPFGQDTDFAIRLQAAGARFGMQEKPGAVWADHHDGRRISHSSTPDVRVAWLNTVRSIISDRAFKADMGWYVAKSYARQGMMRKAAILYLNALVSGAYKPKMAAVVALQVLVGQRPYRMMADAMIRFLPKKGQKAD